MPNYCENDLWISGDPADVAALLAHVGANKDPCEFDFNTVIPYPEALKKRDDDHESMKAEEFAAKYGSHKDGYNSGGYEWCSDNWGTKWNASDVVRRDHGGVCLTFKTAWCPPTPVIIAMHMQFPRVHLSLEWFERGDEKCGGFQCRPKDYWDEDAPWAPGTVTREWKGEYRGVRGG